MRLNRPGEPAYAGAAATFDKVPLILDPQDLGGADVVILGAPIDETTVGRPGTRFGPRAIRAADPAGMGDWRPHMDLGVDVYEALTVVDHGDAEVVPGDAARSHEAIRRSVGQVFEAGAFPVVLGGDHSILHPDAGAAADHFGKGTVGIIHFDAHADDEETLRLAARWERAWLSVDIDVVDPGSAPGTGAPEPGGLTPRELLRAVRRIGRDVGFCGMEVVEVSPPYDQADVTALLAHRVVLEALSGLALRRQGREPAPER